MRKALLVLLILALAISLFPKTKITFWTMSLKPRFTDFVESLVSDYESLHPDVDVVWEDVPWDVLIQKLMAAVAAGDPPDVVNLNMSWSLDLAAQGVLLPVNDLLPKKVLDQYFTSMLDGISTGGKIYGLPWYSAADVNFYNVEIFKKAGLDPKYPPRTWDEVLAYSVIIKEKTGKYGVLPTILQDPQVMFEWDGLPILSSDKKKAAFDTLEHAQVLNKWATMYKLGYLPKGLVEGGEWTKATELYQSGELAMLITGPQFVDRVRDNAPDVYKISDVGPVPLGRSQRYGGWYSTLNIVKGSKNPEVAADFAAFVSNEANELKFCKIATIFPTRKKALEDPFFSKDDGTLETKTRLTAVNALKSVTVFKYDVPNRQELFDKLKEAIISVFLGESDAYEALKECAQHWNGVLGSQ